jgi:4a-hydroxytetrahydrobiopterin dehydratase
MAKLTTDEVRTALQRLPTWSLDADSIKRQFTFAGFPDAVSFIVRLAFEAESADHHPDIFVSYKRVTLTYSTHSEGGLTKKDFDGAAKASEIAASLGASR